MSVPSHYLLESKRTIYTSNPEEWLGRVVDGYDDPCGAQHAPEDAGFVRGSEISIDPGFKNVSEVLKYKKGSKFYAELVKILKGSSSANEATCPEINSANVSRYSFPSHRLAFERLKGNAAAMAAVDKLRWKDRRAYFITALLVTDAYDSVESSSSRSSFAVEANIPAEKATEAVTGMPMPDMPVRVGGDKSRERGRSGRAELQGRRIFAIEYGILHRPYGHRLGREIKFTDERLTKRVFGEDGGGGDAPGEPTTSVDDVVFEEDMLLEDDLDDDDRILKL